MKMNAIMNLMKDGNNLIAVCKEITHKCIGSLLVM